MRAICSLLSEAYMPQGPFIQDQFASRTQFTGFGFGSKAGFPAASVPRSLVTEVVALQGGPLRASSVDSDSWAFNSRASWKASGL